MQGITGPGTLSYPDGTILHVQVRLTFTNGGAHGSGRGTVQSQSIMSVALKKDRPILNCGGVRFHVNLERVRPGYATVETSGAPLT